jgi:hypothetical protein
MGKRLSPREQGTEDARHGVEDQSASHQGRDRAEYRAGWLAEYRRGIAQILGVHRPSK